MATAIRSTSALIVGRSDLFDGEVEKQMLGMCWQGGSSLCPMGMQRSAAKS
jgi:hypothetical protein